MSKRRLARCFLFLDHLDDEGCLCLRLDATDAVDAPLLKRTPADIQALQTEAETILVVPMALASLHLLALPWLSERKARTALPYALEEQLAQPVHDLHFAFDKTYYRQNHYWVVVMSKQRLLDWTAQLDELGIDFDHMTLDWFALNPGECLVTNTHALVYHDDFKGALGPNLMARYREHATSPCRGFLFDNSSAEICSPEFVSIEGDFELFIAKRLAHASFINLCQGELKHDTHRETNVRWYKMSALLFGGWLLSIVGVNAFKLQHLTTQHYQLEQRIATIYREFFPHATVVISPKFRVEHLLKADATGQQGSCWYLLGKLVHAVEQSKSINIEQLRFQQQTLVVNLTTDTFSALEILENHLKQAHLHVTQTQASSQDKHVVAILELQA